MKGYIIKYENDLVCVTNDVDEWLIVNNEQRKKDGEEAETLNTFLIEEVELNIYEVKNMKQEQEIKILKMFNDKDVSFDTFYSYLQERDVGDWDSVNSEDIIKQYCSEMMGKDINISHIVKALESDKSKHELYSIWLGNSMEIPTSINTKQDLIEALCLDFAYIKLQKIRIWNKEIYPEPQWVMICNYKFKGFVNDEDIYYYIEDSAKLDNIKQWDYITLDEEFLVVEVEK